MKLSSNSSTSPPQSPEMVQSVNMALVVDCCIGGLFSILGALNMPEMESAPAAGSGAGKKWQRGSSRYHTVAKGTTNKNSKGNDL